MSFDLFTYPVVAGSKGSAETSHRAALSIDAKTLRSKVLSELGRAPGTADEIAFRLRIDKLSIRPRCSELASLDLIQDSGDRRLNASGKRAVVWEVIPQTNELAA